MHKMKMITTIRVIRTGERKLFKKKRPVKTSGADTEIAIKTFVRGIILISVKVKKKFIPLLVSLDMPGSVTERSVYVIEKDITIA